MAGEAEHRVKNILATVQATVSLSQSDSTDGLKQVIEGRIKALAKVHALFVQSRWAEADLSSIATQELAPYLRDGNGPALVLEPKTAQAIAVALHELATNAAKYGALSVAKGRVEVTWSLATNDKLILTWTEKRGRAVKKPIRQGFGTHIVERVIREQAKTARKVTSRACSEAAL